MRFNFITLSCFIKLFEKFAFLVDDRYNILSDNSVSRLSPEAIYGVNSVALSVVRVVGFSPKVLAAILGMRDS